MRGGRIAVIGGSIAGCAMALAASRSGADEVVVYERAAGELKDRGMGIGINSSRYDELTAAGLMDDDIPWTRIEARRWFAHDGASAFGKELAVQPFPFRGYNWGSLWRELRARIPEDVRYHTDSAVASVSDGPDGAVVRLADGREERFDLVIGADGYRSVVRAAMHPRMVPEYAGYLVWRGTFPTERLAELDELRGESEEWGDYEAVTVGIGVGGASRGESGGDDGGVDVYGGSIGHIMAYRIPAGEDRKIVNWVLYATPPDGLDLNLESPTSLPPGTVTKTLIDHLYGMADSQLPPYWGAAIQLTEPEILAVQPIYDLEVPTCVGSRLLVAGDAAAVARPHSGAGAVKALQDAAVLETIWAEASTWDELLARYDAERRPVGHAMVAMGRQVGQAQVTDAPDWASYDQEGFDAWWASISSAAPLGGKELKR